MPAPAYPVRTRGSQRAAESGHRLPRRRKKRLGVECVRDTEGSLFVLGDKDLLYRAVYNILVNAYQAIGTNGTIHIRGERRDDGMIGAFVPRQRPRFPARPAAQAS